MRRPPIISTALRSSRGRAKALPRRALPRTPTGVEVKRGKQQSMSLKVREKCRIIAAFRNTRVSHAAASSVTAEIRVSVPSVCAAH